MANRDFGIIGGQRQLEAFIGAISACLGDSGFGVVSGPFKEIGRMLALRKKRREKGEEKKEAAAEEICFK
jgi:hypothetical protein